MNKQISITEQLKITYPIIQAPMLGVSTPEMAAAVSNSGGLGSLAVGGLSPEVTRSLIHTTKSLTDKPFAVNLFAHSVPSYTITEAEPMRQLLLKLAKKKGYTLTEKDMSEFEFYTYHDQLEILIEEQISVVSFTFGCLDMKSINLLKNKGILLIGTATCVEEALLLKNNHIDMITAQGIEAGGHRGTFIETIPLPQIGLFSLVPSIAAQVSLPIIAAGGINSPQTIKAAMELGAQAVQVGTAFINTTESIAIPSYKESLNTSGSNTKLTRAFSGRWARGISNELMNEIETSGITIPPYPFQNSLTGKFRKFAQQANDSEYTNLWAGQSLTKTKMQSSKEVFASLIQ